MPELFVSVGSSIEPERNIRRSVCRLRELFGTLQLSPVYQSEAVGFIGENFLNLVLSFQTEQPVATVVDLLHQVEADCGRRRDRNRFAPRSLDLDLLLYGDRVINDNNVHLPRDEILRYAFVLRPLAELAGERRHPVEGRTFAQLWACFDASRQPLWPVRLEFAEDTLG